jgi:hypothetical protein
MPGPPHSAGKVRQSLLRAGSGADVSEKKKAAPKDNVEPEKALIDMYVMPDPGRMQAVFQAGMVSVDAGREGAQELVLKDYAQPGDQMALTFDANGEGLIAVNVSTYMDDPKQPVKLAVRMAVLPDGTNYPKQSVLEVTRKKLRMTTINSDYQRR